MNIEEFAKELKKQAIKLNIELSDEQVEKFYKYMLMIQEWNNKINLTAITDSKEIIIKHFIDSLTCANEIEDNSSVIDIGTGAGFPRYSIKNI